MHIVNIKYLPLTVAAPSPEAPEACRSLQVRALQDSVGRWTVDSFGIHVTASSIENLERDLNRFRAPCVRAR